MVEAYTQQLCRVYTIPCPACGTENAFPRYKRDVVRMKSSGPDGHPIEYGWREEGDFPIWITPITFFWGSCGNCHFSGQVDDGDFRQWKTKNTIKFLAAFHEGSLDKLKSESPSGLGPLGKLSKAEIDTDPFSTILCQFFAGIYSESLKTSPSASVLARSYLRVAWIYRDQERIYGEFSSTSKINGLIDGLREEWNAAIVPNSGYPVLPGLATSEVEALRLALAFFEWNFSSLSSAAGVEDEMRLMTLIAQLGYRLFELTGEENDFTKAQGFFSGSMQKCLSVINDKSIVGGIVNRAKDTLEKAGDRGRELRALKEEYDKSGPPESAPVHPPPKPQKAPDPPAGKSETDASPEQATSAAPAVAPLTNGSAQQKLEQLDQEAKRWMRLAGISELTGLPNRVMLSRVLLPGIFRQTAAKRQPLGCIFLSPEGMAQINGKLGRPLGDELLKEFTKCLQEQIRKGERLAHLEGVNFAILVPGVAVHQLKKRAEIIHKELTSRRFDINGNALSLPVSVGISGIQTYVGTPKTLQEGLYQRSIQALDNAKLKGNQVEVIQES
jgi:diguanylate cyclase (GGDEF)-like protein